MILPRYDVNVKHDIYVFLLNIFREQFLIAADPGPL